MQTTVVLLLCTLVATVFGAEVDLRKYMKKESGHTRTRDIKTNELFGNDQFGYKEWKLSNGKYRGLKSILQSKDTSPNMKSRQKRSSSCGDEKLPSSLSENEAYEWLDFDPEGMKEGTLAVMNFWNSEPYAIMEMATDSIADTKTTFPNEYYANGRSSAFRHALWMYRVTKKFNEETAKAYGDAHERSGKNTLRDKLMDLYNNQAGRCLAQDSKNNGKNDVDVILAAVNNGVLQTKFDTTYKDLPFTCEFRLYTRFNRDSHQVITATNLSGSNFNKNKDSKFIIHGFLSDADTDWMDDMKDEFLTRADYNVFLVDWEDGADKLFTYGKAADNSYEVGRQIYEFIQMLKTKTGYDERKVHLIGHSLGAHASGEAGRRIPTIGRITGLDPAGRNFEDLGTDRRLDASDAQFVDIIHTDSDKYGFLNPIGDVDFYPNGGDDQPGCSPIGLKACDHGRAYVYFTESINVNCAYTSYPCAVGQECSTCGSGQCNRMGFHATKIPGGTFYLETNSNPVYCTD
ncbi:pancreatic triacylglycerol lipase-like [Glandiceps talaboti]